MITVNNKKYILAEDLMDKYPSFFRGCKTSRNIVTKKKIPSKYTVYCRKVNDEWTLSSGKSFKYDKVFLRNCWIKSQIPDFDYDNGSHDDIEYLPELIYLDDHEKFYDNKGNILEIEVRGHREFDKCFFRAKDISECFNIKRLIDIILESSSAYTLNTHYKFFYVKKEKKYQKNIFNVHWVF